jgi:GT2 family glycosyltransferase
VGQHSSVAVPNAGDRPPSAVQRLLESGIFDAEFYAAAVGRRFPHAQAAARDCIEVGMRRGISPNPFLLLTSLPNPVQDRVRAGEVGRLLAYLRSGRGRSKPLGPLFLGEAVPASPEQLAGQSGGAIGWFMRTASDDTEMPVPAGYRGRPPTFAKARQAALAFAATLAEHRPAGGGDAADAAPEPAELASWRSRLVDWAAIDAALATRVAGRTSVVVPTHGDSAMTTRAVLSVLKQADGHDVEVVVVDDGSAPDVGRRLHDRFLTEPRVRYHRLTHNFGFAVASDAGFAMSTGTRVVFLNNDTIVRAGWLAPLHERLDDDRVAGVQPLLLYDNDTIQTAGTVFPTENGLPCHFLSGHPPEDADPVGALAFSAVTAAALMMRAEDVAALRGFDTVYVNGMEDVDLCLRALELRPGGFRVEPRALVTHLEGKAPGRNLHIPANRQEFMTRWHGRLPGPETEHFAACGFAVERVGGDAQPVPAPRPVLTRIGGTGPGSDPPCLRWGIRLSSTPGQWGDRWGDTHFAASLAAALERQGQQVVTYRRGAHHTEAAYLDDVVLAIRGLHPVRPHPGKLNVLWVISHPDDVTVEELVGFDLVFAASVPWSAHMSNRSGRPVLPLLQATDTRWLPDRSTPVGDGREPVFVGTADSGRSRRIVHDALEAGIDVAVHGPGWGDSIPAERWKSEFVSPESVPSLYRTHGLVLADHWPDMAAHGFLANRLFDAVAAGARVISDEVPGLDDVFHGAVQVYGSVDELKHLCGSDGLVRFPNESEIARIGDGVAREQSFGRRAQELLSSLRVLL